MDSYRVRWNSICQRAQQKWLLNEEVFWVLSNYRSIRSRFTRVIPEKPSSGSLFLFNKKRLKNYKKDKIEWQLKKGTSQSVREDHRTLVVANERALHCSYAHSATVATFHRRCYRLLDKDQHIVLVHYFDTSTIELKEDDPQSLDLESPPDDILATDLLQDTPLTPCTISDYSPDWDLCTGGAKILICLGQELPQWLTMQTLYIQFGTKSVAAEKVSNSVLRCTAPSNPSGGAVEFRLVSESGQTLTEHGHVFKYKRSKRNLAADSTPDTGDFKIRVVELHSKATTGDQLLSDSAVNQVEPADLELLSETLVKRVLEQLVVVAEANPELLDELYSLDESGLSLLHYVCMYNYVDLLQLFIARDANLNVTSADGHTPLHVAASCGHAEVVQALLKHNADPNVIDPDGYTAADRAASNGHVAIAAFIGRITGQDMSPTESETDSSASPLKLDAPALGTAFSAMSLHDKCALTLSCSHRSNQDDNNLLTERSKLNAAMKLMGPEELLKLEDEAKVIQNNVRAWFLRRSYRNMRDATRKLQEIDRKRDKAAVTVQAATRSMLARRSYLQQRNIAIKFQAATRGVLCRKKFKLVKQQALASLVIQRNVRAWFNYS